MFCTIFTLTQILQHTVHSANTVTVAHAAIIAGP